MIGLYCVRSTMRVIIKMGCFEVGRKSTARKSAYEGKKGTYEGKKEYARR